MAEYKLSYTASEIDERLAKVDEISINKEHVDKVINDLQAQIDGDVMVAVFNITEDDLTEGSYTFTTGGKFTGVTNVTCDNENSTVSINNEQVTFSFNVAGEYKCKIYGITSIGNYAFKGCSSLTSVIIGDGVTSIGPQAFEGCSSLTSIEIPDSVTSIGSYAFSGCSLTSIEIPDGVTSIGSYAFQYCSSLTRITIPDGITSIEAYAFSNCSSLTSVVIPDGVTSIGGAAFYKCTSLTIYCECEVESQPAGWDSNWNDDNCPVVWGYKHKDYPEVVTKVNAIDNLEESINTIKADSIPQKAGWKVVNKAINHKFSFVSGNVERTGFGNFVEYENLADSTKHIITADIYETSPETIATSENIGLKVLTTITVANKWTSANCHVWSFFPDSFRDSTYSKMTVDKYEWNISGARDLSGDGTITDPVYGTALVFNANGSYYPQTYYSKDMNSWYIYGVAVELDTYNSGNSVNIDGKHIQLTLYDF